MKSCAYQHCCPDVKFFFKLGDKYVNGHEAPGVVVFYLADNVCHPFELFLSPCDPQEVNLKKRWKLDPDLISKNT